MTGGHFPFINALRCGAGYWGRWDLHGVVAPAVHRFSLPLRGSTTRAARPSISASMDVAPISVRPNARRNTEAQCAANRRTLSRTLTRCHARGPDTSHVGGAAQTRIYWLTCASKGERACSGVYVRTCTRPCKSASISQRTNARRFRQSADPLRQNSLF